MVTLMKLPQSGIEDALCSKTRLKILKLLMLSEELTVSVIARRVGVNYRLASTHLEALESEDVLTHVLFGKRVRYYKFKESNRARAIKALIKVWSVNPSQS
jgi:DNA-binding transcriptional ArsR family regulator